MKHFPPISKLNEYVNNIMVIRADFSIRILFALEFMHNQTKEQE